MLKKLSKKLIKNEVDLFGFLLLGMFTIITLFFGIIDMIKAGSFFNPFTRKDVIILLLITIIFRELSNHIDREKIQLSFK
ncbi:hypothetical protein [Candidatus Phytoplasma solani]|uniref:Uncharacterized protein n=1 Tax=Candidatus Phytoplasma solani TaxID=69896 RepID=A0A421NUE8_9MOLU|nr:hypothetical protein [Candidatus Phytoplasma solani]RMI87656.1 hypothetical protein PSSA1_v1c6640 [Candidatus Phytoplasma solani]